MFYLLGTEVIIDISRGTDNPASRWIERLDRFVPAQNIKVSSLSWAAIEFEFQRLEQQQQGRLNPQQAILRQRIRRVFDRYRALKSVLSFGDEATRIWVEHLQGEIYYSEGRSAGSEEKMILAIAIAGYQDAMITLVARKEIAHQRFEILGLKVEDPYDERTTT